MNVHSNIYFFHCYNIRTNANTMIFDVKFPRTRVKSSRTKKKLRKVFSLLLRNKTELGLILPALTVTHDIKNEPNICRIFCINANYLFINVSFVELQSVAHISVFFSLFVRRARVLASKSLLCMCVYISYSLYIWRNSFSVFFLVGFCFCLVNLLLHAAFF